MYNIIEDFALYVFPARAGMSPSPLMVSLSLSGVPRASGDEPWITPQLNRFR